MTFKLFRRGSARCVGLLSAFVTILLCLYYISMGQQAGITSQTIREIGSSTMTNNPLASAPAASSGFDSNGDGDSDSGVNDEVAVVQQYNQKQKNGLDEDSNLNQKQDRNNRIYEYDLQQQQLLLQQQHESSKQHEQLKDKRNMNQRGEIKDGGITAGNHVRTALQYSNEQLLRFHSRQHPNEGTMSSSAFLNVHTTNNNISETKAAVMTSAVTKTGSDFVDTGIVAPSLNFIGNSNGLGQMEKGGHPMNWSAKCYYHLDESDTNITAIDEYAKFDFQPEWIRTKEYWDRFFEERFEAQKNDNQRPPLKVIIVPHSHNDPGWLKTFINYFQSDSKQILNLMIGKMQEYKDLTFIWPEISFLQLWWDQAHPSKQRALKRLINSGRFEITTGGWVMSDEANVHIYAMLDQLIEGHQWLKNNLNVTPKVGWSIDPFGHGSTMPYLLSGSQFEGTIIQRIHYAWKQWFAHQMSGDFIWKPYWRQRHYKEGIETPLRKSFDGSLLTHNMPFDIYSIKGSCGPHPFICLNFDFRKIPGEYTEYSIKATFITDENVAEKAELLLEQYARTASLFPHNVALIPVGDDFRYNKEREIIQQYTNYKKLMNYIIENKSTYNVDISFGTPSDYFREIRKRSKKFPTFKGDFYVYSDIFSEGRPAYWSGYYTTRPFYKILSADLEHNLRAAEILFTFAYNFARQHRNAIAIKIFEKNYERIIHARRNLGLFQHHDAITGTSKIAVMRDYGMRLLESMQDVVKMQESTIELLIQNDTEFKHNFLLYDLERENFGKMPRKTALPLSVSSQSGNLTLEVLPGDGAGRIASFVVFNPLTQKRFDVLIVRTTTCKIKLLDGNGKLITNIQINPVWNITEPFDMYPPPLEPLQNIGLGGGSSTKKNTGAQNHLRPSRRIYEILFMAELDPLSITTYQVVVDEVNYLSYMSTIYCDSCQNGGQQDGEEPVRTTSFSTSSDSDDFVIKNKPSGDIQLENSRMRLLFDEKSGFLTSLSRKDSIQKSTTTKPMQCAIKFAAYRSAQFHSGAYLFKTDPEQSETEKNVLEQYDGDMRIIITTGNIASEVTVLYGPFLAHTVRLYNTHTMLDGGVFIENDVDFESPPKNRETELFMRFVTDIDNIAVVNRDLLKEGEPIPELPQFYTDQNGFQFHKRIKIPSIGIEGNYFPITTMAFMQDEKRRFTLLTTHAQGAASYEPGQLEVMLDRRTLYDDYRGLGEGIVDSRLTRHKFWFIIEDIIRAEAETENSSGYKVPSLMANYFASGLRNPPNIYFVENFDKPPQLKSKIQLLGTQNTSWPCDMHLLNLRTLSEEQLPLFPAPSTLMILQRQGFDCSFNEQWVGQLKSVCTVLSAPTLGNNVQFNRLRIERLEVTSLTGTLPAHKRRSLKSFNEIFVKPMELLTLNLTFKN